MSTAAAASSDPGFSVGFARFLSEKGLLDELSFHRALAAEARSRERFTSVLTRLGLIAETDLARALAQHLELPLAGREDVPEEPVLPELLQPDFLKSQLVLPLRHDAGTLDLAMVDPTADEPWRAVAYLVQCEVRRLAIAPADFAWAWERLHGLPASPADPRDTEALADLDVARLKELASEAPTVRFVNRLLAEAVEARASDIHIEPGESELAVRFRIDGHLLPVKSLPVTQGPAVVSRVKIVAGLDIGERRLPQDGRIQTAVRGVEIDLRVSCLPTLHGEGIVIRLLDRRGLELSLPSLGFPERTCQSLRAALARPSGIVLVTGPTGSGKTTTLYAALAALKAPRRKLVTVEDPVEYQLPGVSQIHVHPAIGLSFAAALRAILRHDPDVVMVGEIRDAETARIAAQASLTGHLVLSTVHTNSAAATLTRLIDMGIEDYLLASTLQAVLAQRLVRRLCERCAAPDPDPAPLLALAQASAIDIGEHRIKRAVGCAPCRGTGYVGRTVLSELMLVTPGIRELIRSRASEAALVDAARAEGMRTLIADGLAKVAAGITTLSEVTEAVGA